MSSLESYFEDCWGCINADQLDFLNNDPDIRLLYNYLYDGEKSGGAVTKDLSKYGQGSSVRKNVSMQQHGRGAHRKNIKIKKTTKKKIIIHQNIVVRPAVEAYVPDVVTCPNKDFYKHFY